MSHGREKWKFGGRSAPIKDDDPSWMYHQPAPDPWEQTLNKWEKRMSFDKPKYEQQDNDGVVFVNDKKTEDWHSDWSGKAMVDGKMYWLSQYDNTSAGGKSYRKLKFKPMDESGNAGGYRPAPAKPKDDIPW